MSHPFDNIRRDLRGRDYFDITALGDSRLSSLPTSIRVLLEGAVRHCDGFLVTDKDVEKIMDWQNTRGAVEIPFFPARVLLQDYTGVPCVVDLAAMRDAIASVGGNPSSINPQIPVDLVVDHSVQVDATRSAEAREQNEAKEFERNAERFKFLKWGAQSFDNLRIVPPGNGIVHQVNLEYLARVAFTDKALYPDSVVGTDSHTTMVNGLGVLGWGVGGIEAEAAMLGQPISMLLPHVVGFRLTGEMPPGATATDVVLTVTNMLRKVGVVGKFVEFFGKGVASLSLADRSTISNMAPEYGATCGLFPVDETALAYMLQTGRSEEHVTMVRDYLQAVGLFADYEAESTVKYSEVVELDLSTVLPCIAGPKRPQDLVAVKDQKSDFAACLTAAPGAKGFGVATDALSKTVPLVSNGHAYQLSHGSVVIAAITSCTNTSNPAVLISAGIVAQRALAKGLTVAPYIKTSLSPGSQVVEAYLRACGLIEPLAQQGFAIAGYGCMTCIGNSGDLYEGVSEAINASGIMAGAVLSGNRNFEGRVHPDTMANYLASPPLVVAYALAGTVNIDLTNEPLGTGSDGKPVFMADLWPSRAEVDELIRQHVTPATFSQVYNNILKGNARWDSLPVTRSADGRYAWDEESTYIHQPPFFTGFTSTPSPHPPVQNAHCLLLLGDSITTDHISPAGSIHKASAAAKYLLERGVQKQDFNSYGARRGNDLVMTRGTFANTRLSNRLAGQGATGPVTVHIPSGEMLSVYDAAMRYKADGVPTVVIAGKEYGSGSSRDWAAKGPFLLGVRAVIAESFERIHRSNLVGMGVLPLCFKPGESATSHGIKGNETITIHFGGEVKPGQDVQVTVGETMFTTTLRIDTDAEMGYFAHGGILPYVVRKLAAGVTQA